MPVTIINWNEPASLPRWWAGAISEMYIGPTTEDAPTAMPPIKRKVTNKIQTDVDAQPIADNRYRMEIKMSTFLRPYFFLKIFVWQIHPAIGSTKLSNFFLRARWQQLGVLGKVSQFCARDWYPIKNTAFFRSLGMVLVLPDIQ